MLHLFSGMDTFNLLLAFLAALTAVFIGYSAIHYIFFSNPKDEINFEDDDSIYAFYGAGPRRGSAKKVSFDI